MLIMVSILRVGQSEFVKEQIDEDTVDRIMSCFRSLSESRKELEDTFLEDSKTAFRNMVDVADKKREDLASLEKSKSAIQIDDAVKIRQLTKRTVDGAEEMGLDLEKATGGDAATEDLTSKLSRVVQLTGFSGEFFKLCFVMLIQY
jgi:coatomer subunit beta